MDCPKCKDTKYCKDGIINGRQRYQCKSCSYRYTVSQRSNARSNEIKRMALSMFLEGLDYRVIGRILQVNYVTVFYWIKEWGIHVKKLKSDTPIRSIEIQELHDIVSQKKKTKGYVMLLTDIKTGWSVLCRDEQRTK